MTITLHPEHHYITFHPERYRIHDMVGHYIFHEGLRPNFITQEQRNYPNLINEEGMWQRLLKNKYLNSKSLSQVSKRAGESQFWSGLMMLKISSCLWGDLKSIVGNKLDFGRMSGWGMKP
jgi:hypothetical protein